MVDTTKSKVSYFSFPHGVWQIFPPDIVASVNGPMGLLAVTLKVFCVTMPPK